LSNLRPQHRGQNLHQNFGEEGKKRCKAGKKARGHLRGKNRGGTSIRKKRERKKGKITSDEEKRCVQIATKRNLPSSLKQRG